MARIPLRDLKVKVVDLPGEDLVALVLDAVLPGNDGVLILTAGVLTAQLPLDFAHGGTAATDFPTANQLVKTTGTVLTETTFISETARGVAVSGDPVGVTANEDFAILQGLQGTTELSVTGARGGVRAALFAYGQADIELGYGVRAEINADDTAVIHQAAAVYVPAFPIAGTATVETAIAFGAQDVTAGTVSNIGLFLGSAATDLSDAPAGDWAIYSKSATQSYLKGRVTAVAPVASVTTDDDVAAIAGYGSSNENAVGSLGKRGGVYGECLVFATGSVPLVYGVAAKAGSGGIATANAAASIKAVAPTAGIGSTVQKAISFGEYAPALVGTGGNVGLLLGSNSATFSDAPAGNWAIYSLSARDSKLLGKLTAPSLQMTTAATIGYVLTATDTNGNMSWQAGGTGGPYTSPYFILGDGSTIPVSSTTFSKSGTGVQNISTQGTSGYFEILYTGAVDGVTGPAINGRLSDGGSVAGDGGQAVRGVAFTTAGATNAKGVYVGTFGTASHNSAVACDALVGVHGDLGDAVGAVSRGAAIWAMDQSTGLSNTANIAITSGGVLSAIATGRWAIASSTTRASYLSGKLTVPTFQVTTGATNGYVATSDASGNLSWAAPATSGTVTSVNASGGTTGLSFSGGPVTTTGTLTLSGTLVVANGGTGLAVTTAYAVLCGGTTTTGALQSIASVGTSGQVLTSNGAGALPTFQAATGGITTLNTLTGATQTFTNDTNVTIVSGGTAHVITWAGTLAVARGGTGTGSAGITAFNNITGYTAAGATGTTSTSLVFSTSPTLVTPLLGTPTSGVLTNCTGYTVANLSGLGANVATFLGTPSSANLAAAVTDETGSSLLVFNTSPTIVTPTISSQSSAAGVTEAFSATAAAQITTSQAGSAVTITASAAIAGSGTNGAAAGGSVTITSGAAARLVSGDANGGNISLVTGAGIGAGTRGQVLIQDNVSPAFAKPSLSFVGANSSGLSVDGGGNVTWVQGGVSIFQANATPLFILSPTYAIAWNSAAVGTGGGPDSGLGRVVAGVVAMTAGNGGVGWLQQSAGRARVTGNVTNATTNMVNITGLSATLIAGRKYTGRVMLFAANSVAVDGLALDFDGGTATMTSFEAAVTSNVQGATAGVTVSQALATDMTFTAMSGTGRNGIVIEFGLVCNAAGTFIPRFSLNSATTGTATIYLNSNMWVDDMPA